jgi:hypothetical protein
LRSNLVASQPDFSQVAVVGSASRSATAAVCLKAGSRTATPATRLRSNLVASQPDFSQVAVVGSTWRIRNDRCLPEGRQQNRNTRNQVAQQPGCIAT